MVALLLVLHVLVSVVLVTVVLLQAGRGGGISGAFGGGGGSQALFGGRGAATFLSKATVVLGVLFFVTSLGLAILSARGPTTRRSLIQEEAGRTRPGAGAPAPASRPGVPEGTGQAQPGGAAPAAPSGQGGGAPASEPAPAQPGQGGR